MKNKPLTTIQAEARAAFDEKFPVGRYWDDYAEPEDIKSFLDTQLSLAHAAGKAEAVEYIKSVSTREIDGTWLPDDMHAYWDSELEDARLPHTEEKN